MAGSGRKAHPEGQYALQGVVGRPSRRAGSGQEALLASWSDRESLLEGCKALPEGREALPEGRESIPEVRGSWVWLESPHGRPRVVGSPSRRVGRPSLRAGSGWEALTEGRE